MLFRIIRPNESPLFIHGHTNILATRIVTLPRDTDTVQLIIAVSNFRFAYLPNCFNF